MSDKEGQITKLRIEAYDGPDYKNPIPNGVYKVHLNPEGYNYNYLVKYKDDQGLGSSGSQPKFNRIEPEEVDFDFIFDKTGAIPGTIKAEKADARIAERADGIIPDIEKFKKVVYDYDGKMHRPPFLKLIWGTMLFKGILVQMNIIFKLFLPDGTPIRAVVNAKFRGSVENSLRVRIENDESSDVTHVRVVKEGDKLPLMAYEIYKDPAYYIKVAQFNKLVNFRNLQPGQKILFPPFKEGSNGK